MLIGIHTAIVECSQCKIKIYGGTPNGSICPKCRRHCCFNHIGTIGEHDKLPSNGFCDACEKEVDEHKRIVAAGGVYWQCRGCKQKGVIRETAELSALVRKEMKIEAPDPCGIEFEKCEEHTVKPEDPK